MNILQFILLLDIWSVYIGGIFANTHLSECMRFPVTMYPYHLLVSSLVSSAFIVLANPLYSDISVMFYFAFSGWLIVLTTFLCSLAIWIWPCEVCLFQLILACFSFDFSFSWWFVGVVYILWIKPFFGKLFFPLKFYIGGMNG